PIRRAVMRPSAIRERILEDHATLRRIVARIDDLGEQVRVGREDLFRELCIAARDLHGALLRHLDREDRLLRPFLQTSDAFGPVRVDKLDEEHTAQRAELVALVSRLGALSPEDLADYLIGFGRRLLEDMKHEEGTILHPRFLKDDLVHVDLGG
ncbi:MAG: hemerythrin domain-containing protein, partial [Myxococcales bacterium]|nr:hemerythrin domain-containing protein [Myxococcales bacterium]